MGGVPATLGERFASQVFKKTIRKKNNWWRRKVSFSPGGGKGKRMWKRFGGGKSFGLPIRKLGKRTDHVPQAKVGKGF